MDAGAAVAVWLLAAGESGLLVGRRQHNLFARSVCTICLHGLFARVGAGGKYLGLVGRGGRTVRRRLLVQRQKEEEDEDDEEAEEAEEAEEER